MRHRHSSLIRFVLHSFFSPPHYLSPFYRNLSHLKDEGNSSSNGDTTHYIIVHCPRVDISCSRRVIATRNSAHLLILGVCILLHVWDRGENVSRLLNFNIIGFYYLFNCATCFGHTTFFKYTYFPRTYLLTEIKFLYKKTITKQRIIHPTPPQCKKETAEPLSLEYILRKYVFLEDGRMTETCIVVK
jgi:hypothetical protein